MLQAASEPFAREGLGVTLNDVAHHAGVGVATAYRHFANKGEVIETLFRQRLDHWVETAERSAADPDGWRGLTTFIERSMEALRWDRGLRDLIGPSGARSELAEQTRARITPLVSHIVEKAVAQGAVRPDLTGTGTDIAFIQVALTSILDITGAPEPEHYRRFLTLFLDGMRAGEATRNRLPVPAMDSTSTHASMTNLPRRR